MALERSGRLNVMNCIRDTPKSRRQWKRRRKKSVRSIFLGLFILLILTVNFKRRVAPFIPSETDLKSFTAIVLTLDRDVSLLRLLRSLEDSNYSGVSVTLEIRIDIAEDGEVHEPTLAVAKSFQFSHGPKVVHVSKSSLGLAGSWFAAWEPTANSGMAIILEDDIVLSPHWFLWLSRVWHKYENVSLLAGITLQRQTLVPMKPSKQRELRSGHEPFLYPLVGSIGFSPHPIVWKQFVHWVKHLPGDFDVSTPGLVTSDWWNEFDRRHMWTQHFIYFSLQRGLYTLYQSMSDGTSLASHMRQRGMHFKSDRGPDFQPELNIPPMKFPDSLQKFTWSGNRLRHPSDGFDEITESTLLSRGLAISKSYGFVFLLFANSAFIDMTQNWICNVLALDRDILQQTIIVADNYQTVAALSALEQNIDYFVFNSVYSEDAQFGTFKYYRIVLERLIVQNRMLQHGISIMVIESDQIWLSDIRSVLREAFLSGSDIVAGNERANEPGAEAWYVCGGFYGIASNVATRPFFDNYVSTHTAVLMKYKHKKGRISVENDQALLSRLLRDEKLTIDWLDKCQYTNGMWYNSTDFRASCEECKTLGILHNNYIVGTINKVSRAKEWSQWFMSSGQCVL